MKDNEVISRINCIIGCGYLPQPYKDTEALETAIEAVRSRKTGHWIDKGSLSCRCSECGCKSNKETRFCANCGAKMEG